MDLLVDMEEGDLVFQNSACPIVTNEGDVVAQRLYIRLRTMRTEWFMNLSYGVPYQTIMGIKIDKNKIDSILQQQVLNTEGVREIVTWSSTFNSSNRSYECTFNVRTTNNVVTDPITITTPFTSQGTT